MHLFISHHPSSSLFSLLSEKEGWKDSQVFTVVFNNSRIGILRMGSSISQQQQQQQQQMQQQQQQQEQQEPVSACPMKSKATSLKTSTVAQAAADSSSQCPMKATNTTTADKKIYKNPVVYNVS